MKRFLALILALLMAVGMFAACTAVEPEIPESQTKEDTEKEMKKETADSDNEGSSNNGGNSDFISTDIYTREGNKILFGLYPQSEVTKESLISTLNSKTGELPTSDNAQAWTSYGYYISGSESNFMWYIDIEEDGERYRGVYFNSFRPYNTDFQSFADNSYQDEYVYTTSVVYWFKYEHISWTILNENSTDKTALILCDMIIDAQAYQDVDEYNNNTGKHYNTSTGVPDETYANNYAYSTIRKWLNEIFYTTAFNELQKRIILTTTVDNGVASTCHEMNGYVCENTQDKIFLLSAQETTNTTYGFASSTSTYDTARRKKMTDYAKVQGAYTSKSADYAGNGRWWLRSPDIFSSAYAHEIYDRGDVTGNSVTYSFNGVVPALQIRLS